MTKTAETFNPAADTVDFRQNLAAQAEAISNGYVPSVEELDQLQETASSLHELANGSIQSPSGFVNKEQAATVAEAADPKHWMLSHADLVANEKIANASHFSEIKDIVQRDTSVPAFEQLRRLKEQASAKLSLSEQLRAQQKSAALQRGAELRSRREAILDKKMSDELASVKEGVFERALKDETAKIDEKLAETSQDTLNQYYAKKEFEQTAKKSAKEAADQAAEERKAKIQAHGGAAAISHLKSQEEDAAKKADFRKRVLGIDDTTATEPEQVKNQPDWAENKYNPAVHGSYKNYLESGGARKADVISEKPSATDAEAKKLDEVADDFATAQRILDSDAETSTPKTATEYEGILGDTLKDHPLVQDKLDLVLDMIASGYKRDDKLVSSLEADLHKIAESIPEEDRRAFYKVLGGVIRQAYRGANKQDTYDQSTADEEVSYFEQLEDVVGPFAEEYFSDTEYDDGLDSDEFISEFSENILSEEEDTDSSKRFGQVLKSARKLLRGGLVTKAAVAGQNSFSKMIDKAANYFGDEEKGRRRKTVAAVAVVAGVGAVWLSTKYGLDLPGGKGGNADLADQLPNGDLADQLPSGSEAATDGASMSSVLEGVQDTPELVNVHISPGEGTSHIAANQLGISFDSAEQWHQFNEATNPLFEGLDGFYQDAATGEWRISNTGDLQIPQDILDKMAEEAEKIR